MNNDDDIFLKKMKGVNPIKKNNKVKKEELIKNYKFVNKKKTKYTNTKLSNPDKKIKNSEFNLEKMDLRKSIRKGSFNIDKKIDFHGKTLIESEERFNKTIIECYNSGLRCLLFVTGKGLFKSRNAEKIEKPKLYHGVIRSSFVQWVKSNKLSRYVLSFEKASIEHGGDGAFYVYLRKKK
jgi:DNA-nicking Smr family endonuclease